MKPESLVLRCYAKKAGNQYVAICIDLSLAAQADSMDDAICKLEEMTRTYLTEALTEHEEYAEQLLHRPAPLSQRLEYFALRAAFRLASIKEHFQDKNVFSKVFPLQLA